MKLLVCIAAILFAVGAVAITFGVETLKIWFQISLGIYALILCNVVLRALVMAVAQFIGFNHPALEAYWPRLPWRPMQVVRKTILEKYERVFVMGKRSNGGFLPFLSTLLLRYRKGMLVYGRVMLLDFKWPQYAAEDISRHLSILGQTGGGKSNFLANLIAMTPNTASMFVIDPKSMFSNTVLAAKKAMGMAVFTVDVLGTGGALTASINPIKTIFELNEVTGKDYTTIIVVGICLALIPKSKFEKPFFHNKAVEIVSAIILHEISINPDTDLVQICDRVFAGYAEHVETPTDAQEMHLRAMAANPSFDGFISRIATLALSMDQRTFSNIMATATAPLLWLMHPQTKKFIVRHDVSILDLKSNKRKVIIALACTPTAMRDEFAGYFRMMVFIVLKVMEFYKLELKERTRIIVEEMGTIGAINSLPEVWPLLRGYGGLGVGVVQELEGFKRYYPDHWRTILGNSDAVVCLQTEDPETLEHISKNYLGERTRTVKENGQKRSVTNRVMEPEALKRYLAYTKGKGGRVIVGRAGKRPLKLFMPEYFRDSPVFLYEQDVAHREPTGRAFGRSLVERFRAYWAAPITTQEFTDDDSKLLSVIEAKRGS